MKKILFGTLAILLSLSYFSLSSYANEELLTRQNNSAEWVMQLGNYSGQRYSKLGQINRSNASKLSPVWSFSTGVLRGHEGGPLVLGNTMYVHTPFPNKVFALDLNNDGTILWSYEPVQDPTVIGVMCCDTVNRGLSYAEGKIFLHQADTTLVALDAKTGEVIWSTKNGDPAKGETGTSNPLVVKDKVLVGISGGEYGIQGHLTAYNLETGEMEWRAYSVGPDSNTLIEAGKTTELGKPVKKDEGVTTWEGDQWKIGGGATWGWITYDPDLDLIYYGSSNPGTWNPVQRPGDNKWSMTIFARNPDTGMAKWVYQMTPHDEWDYDGINENILADINVKGKMTKALVHFDRNGFAYTMDRESGALLVAEKFDPAVNWATGIDMKTGRPMGVAKYSTEHQGEDVNTQGICPAALGSKDQQPASFSPRTKLFYVPTNHVCMDYEPYNVSYTAGQAYIGATLTMYPPKNEEHLGNMIAWDASNGRIVWSIPEPFSVWSGVLTTEGDVVFYGTLEGYLKVVDARSGRLLYKYKTPSGIIGNVNTYMHKGTQYVAVYSGLGGWAGIGFAAGLTGDTDGLGAVGAYRSLSSYTKLGGVLTVFAIR